MEELTLKYFVGGDYLLFCFNSKHFKKFNISNFLLESKNKALSSAPYFAVYCLRLIYSTLNEKKITRG